MEIAQYAKALAVIAPTLLLALPAKALASNRCSLTKARCHLDESCDDSLSDLTASRLHWAATNLRPARLSPLLGDRGSDGPGI